jgi:TRAP-type C4-dicarboxylate transport system substrate-binding protein
MKKLFFAILGLGIIIGMAYPAIAAQKNFELSLNTWVGNEKHPLYRNILKPWADEVEKQSNGRLKITIYVNNALASNKVAYNAVKDDVCDITGMFPGGDPKRFPLVRLLSLPMIYSSGEVASKAFLDLRKKYPQFDEEFKAVKILWMGTNDVSHIMSVSKNPITKIEDLKGKICANPRVKGSGSKTRAYQFPGSVSRRPEKGL